MSALRETCKNIYIYSEIVLTSVVLNCLFRETINYKQ